MHVWLFEATGGVFFSKTRGRQKKRAKRETAAVVSYNDLDHDTILTGNINETLALA